MKKITAILLLLCLIISLPVSCGSNPPADDGNNTDTTANASEDSTSAADTTAKTDKNTTPDPADHEHDFENGVCSKCGIQCKFDNDFGYLEISGTSACTIVEYKNKTCEKIEIPAEVGGLRVTAIGHSVFSDCDSATSVTIPDGVTEIGISAFFGCGEVTEVTLPSGLVSIGNNAFRNCTKLEIITLPDSVTEIGIAAFCACRSLTSIRIPDQVTVIRNQAFSKCQNVTSVSIPAGVTVIENNAFSDCNKLSEFTFGGTTAQWEAIEKGNSWFTSTHSYYTVVCTDGTL